ncbi:MAG: metallophosphoesterase [Parcubacteria group bacterium]
MIRKIAKWLIALTLLFAGLVIYIWSETNVPAIRNINIPLADFPGKLKIVHISDSHGREISENGRLIRAIRSFSPDVVVLTGDMIDKSTTDFTPVLNTISELSGAYPVLFIPGNHEHANPKGELFINSVRRSGATVLLNDSRIINGISICGVDDINLGLADVPAAMEANGRCDILLSHSPAINESIRGLNIPLVLAGHTHGGQIRLPVVGALLLPDQNIPANLVNGLVNDDGTWFYVSVGLGTSVIPVRFMDRAEVGLITVTPE